MTGTPGARWAAWQIVSRGNEQRWLAGIVAFCLRVRTVWLVLDANKDSLEAIRIELNIEAEERSLETEHGLSPDARRFNPGESVDVRLLSSERQLRLQLSHSCGRLQSSRAQ